VLFNVLNDDFVVGHIGLVPAHFAAVTFSSACVPRFAVIVLSVDAIFEN